MFEYRCKVVKIVDGDTVDVDIDLGFGVWLRDERVRMFGIDAPESRTSDAVEKVFGFAAKDFLINAFDTDKQIFLISEEFKGKFGRILGDFLVQGDEITLGKQMINENYAVEYFGQSKALIEEAHLNNRKILVDAGKVILPEGMTL